MGTLRYRQRVSALTAVDGDERVALRLAIGDRWKVVVDIAYPTAWTVGHRPLVADSCHRSPDDVGEALLLEGVVVYDNGLATRRPGVTMLQDDSQAIPFVGLRDEVCGCTLLTFGDPGASLQALALDVVTRTGCVPWPVHDVSIRQWCATETSVRCALICGRPQFTGSIVLGDVGYRLALTERASAGAPSEVLWRDADRSLGAAALELMAWARRWADLGVTSCAAEPGVQVAEPVRRGRHRPPPPAARACLA